MKKILLLFIIFFISCRKNPKAYQIIVTPEKEYYTTFYSIDSDNCISFISYDGDDSTRIELCKPWDVKPNPDAY